MRTRTTIAAALATSAIALTGLAIAGNTTTETVATTTSEAAAAEARAPEAMLVVFHADWCGNCKVLGPKVSNEVLPEVTGEPLLMVELDLTDSKSNQAEYMLAALGLSDLWEKYGRKTGFALLVDAETKEVLQTFTRQSQPEVMVKQITVATKD